MLSKFKVIPFYFADLLLGKATVTDDEIERKAHSVLGEFFINESIKVKPFTVKPVTLI